MFTKIANIAVVLTLIAGLIAGLAATIILFSWGIDHMRNGRIFVGLLYVLVWSELGGIVVGLSLMLPASLYLGRLQKGAGEKDLEHRYSN